MKKPQKRPRLKSVNQLYYGDEPIFSPQLVPHSNLEIITALSYYNVQFSQDDAKIEVLKFAEQNYPKDIVKQIDKLKWVCNLGALCRMQSRGCIFPEQNLIHNKISKILKENVDSEEDSVIIEKIRKPRKPPSADSIYYSNIIIDYIEDEALRRTFIKPSNLKKYLDLNKIPDNMYKDIANQIAFHSKEIEDAYLKSDSQLVEGYASFCKKDIKRYYELYKFFIDGMKEFVPVKKQRKKKIVPKSKKVEKVKYLKQCDELGLKSISPEEILGKQFAVLYNTRYKTVSILKGKSFDIRGTTIYGFDEENSVKKTLRKPNEMLKSLLTQKTMDGIMNAFNGIATKQQVPVGSLNENTLILKVI